jgi:flavin reductase (DIM6/NTAB) family NADH-FMN oxidoreductase RutF
MPVAESLGIVRNLMEHCQGFKDSGKIIYLYHPILYLVKKMQTLTESDAVALSGPFVYTLISSLDREGRPNVMGASWATRTSFKPFLWLISIDRRRYSYDGIDLHKEFVLHFPSEEQAEAAWICGIRSGRDEDKIKSSGLKLLPSRSVKVPRIDGVTAAFECKVLDQMETGDHTVFIGEVVGISGSPEKARHLFVSSDHKLFGMAGAGNP